MAACTFRYRHNGQTGEPKLFAGGDIVNRTADAISAIADGHRAAKGIDRFLSKDFLLNGK